MKIIFSGVPLYSKKLVNELSKYDKKNEYLYINMKSSFSEKLYFYLHMLTADILFVSYVDSHYMKAVDYALRLNKKVILSWIGTDVSNAIPLIKEETFNKNYINKVFHTTASVWLKEELKEVNIQAKYLINQVCENKYFEFFVPKKFIVLTRMTKGRELFYGMDTILKLAKDFKDIEFRIAGIDTYDNLPMNITLLGWVDMEEEYKNCSVFVRYMKHDGESHCVVEALSYGKEVFYNYDFPYVNFIDNYKSLKQGLETTLLKYNEGSLGPNYKGIEFIESNYNKEKVLEGYKKLFKESFS